MQFGLLTELIGGNQNSHSRKHDADMFFHSMNQTSRSSIIWVRSVPILAQKIGIIENGINIETLLTLAPASSSLIRQSDFPCIAASISGVLKRKIRQKNKTNSHKTNRQRNQIRKFKFYLSSFLTCLCLFTTSGCTDRSKSMERTYSQAHQTMSTKSKQMTRNRFRQRSTTW